MLRAHDNFGTAEIAQWRPHHDSFGCGTAPAIDFDPPRITGPRAGSVVVDNDAMVNCAANPAAETEPQAHRSSVEHMHRLRLTQPGMQIVENTPEGRSDYFDLAIVGNGVDPRLCNANANILERPSHHINNVH